MPEPSHDPSIADEEVVAVSSYSVVSGFMSDDPNEAEDGVGIPIVRVSFGMDDSFTQSPAYMMQANNAAELIGALITSGTQVAGDGFIVRVLREVMKNEQNVPPTT